MDFGKDERFIAHTRQPLNGGPPLNQLRAAFRTPTERFFVRNHAPVPTIDAESFRLKIGGLVERPLSLSLGELRRDFPQHDLIATLQCAGNRRDEMLSEASNWGSAVPWGSEAIGNASWQGVRLADILAAAGPRAEATHLVALGLDDCSAETGDMNERGFGGSIPHGQSARPRNPARLRHE